MPDSRPVTIHDVANKAGVAVSSVSRVLSNHPDVSKAMKIRVEAAAKELGYSPDPVAQSLRSGSTRLIGLVVRDFANPFFGEMIHGVEEVLTEAGYTLLVTNSGGDATQEIERILMLRQRRVDALLLSTVTDKSLPTRKAIASFKKPVVLIDRDFNKVPAGCIQLDHASGVQAATADLLQLGHRRIALITGTIDIRPTRERLRGFEAAFQAAGIDRANAMEITGVFSASFARAKTAELLGLPVKERPTAIIAGGVQSTIGILESLSEMGMRPGDDLSLVVCDDLPWLRVLRPTISAVSRDAEGMGRAAAEMVLSLIAGSIPTTITMPTRYEARDTSRPAHSVRS
jgi:LacI family transcriptional regulator